MMNGSKSIFQYSALMGGKNVALSKFDGYATLIVNTASMCSFTTSNMQQLQQVQQTYGPQGFTVLAFPCAQFARQEPKSNEEIDVWAKEWKVNFPVFDKVNVKGNDAHPLFQMIQNALGPIRWNYTKIVCNREGLPLVKLPPTASQNELEQMIKQHCFPHSNK